MKVRDFFTSSIFLKSIFALSLFILIFISAISYKHSTSLNNSTEALMHSYTVRNEIEVLMSHLKDAETGERGFIISSDSSFLEPYIGARKNVNRSLYILKKLAVENAQQQNNIDTLYDLISLQFSYLTKTLKLKQSHKLSDTLIADNLTKEKEVMNLLRNHTNKMVGLELKVLKEKQLKLKNEISFTPLFTLLLLLFSLFVFFISYLKISNNIEILKASNAKLLVQTESILHAEKIGNFSTWIWDLDFNEISFSDNQAEMLGLSKVTNLTMDNYLTFVHPDDRHLLIDNREKVKKERIPSKAFYRIITKSGETKYFSSIGKIIKAPKGKRILIGINTDVTDQYKKSVALEERNFELEQSNKELASFNYVASHDLQEPLRIIQTFISRIAEKEKQILTETAKDYFDRIQSSANRMQILINDLLLFSRTNKVEKVFEKVDLNILLEQVKQELSEQINAKNATINFGNLPALNVIPFQIQQLFNNLINNSIKYSKHNVALIIEVNYELVNGLDYKLLKMDPEKLFHKISFSDNGIGFEQQYAENIFILFKRLHQKNEFPGTGIGLSICKKIADNHSGFIIAEGILNVGATFSLFLPA